MRRHLPIALLATTLLASTLLCAGCSSLEVKNQFAPGSTLAGHRTFALMGPPPNAYETPAVKEFIADRINKEVTAGLRNRGYGEVPADSADLLVAIHGSADGRVEATRWGYTTVGWDAFGVWGTGYYADDKSYRIAVLTIDLVDGKSKALIYRGWAKGPVGVNGQATQDEIRKIVDKMLKDVPKAS